MTNFLATKPIPPPGKTDVISPVTRTVDKYKTPGRWYWFHLQRICHPLNPWPFTNDKFTMTFPVWILWKCSQITDFDHIIIPLHCARSLNDKTTEYTCNSRVFPHQIRIPHILCESHNRIQDILVIHVTLEIPVCTSRTEIQYIPLSWCTSYTCILCAIWT